MEGPAQCFFSFKNKVQTQSLPLGVWGQERRWGWQGEAGLWGELLLRDTSGSGVGECHRLVLPPVLV